MSKVNEWRKNNPEKYRQQKLRELERRKQRRKGEDIIYDEVIPWNKGQRKYNEEERRIQKLLIGCKKRAKVKNIEYDITVDDVEIVTHCPYLNVEIDYSGIQGDNMASVDRVIPDLGYVKGNIEVVSMLANQMKSNATVEQLLLFSESIKDRYVKTPPAPA